MREPKGISPFCAPFYSFKLRVLRLNLEKNRSINSGIKLFHNEFSIASSFNLLAMAYRVLSRNWKTLRRKK